MSQRLVLLLAVAALTLTPAATFAQTTSAALPRNIRVPDVYAPWIEALIARSPTLQRQCALIAGADRVVVQLSSGSRTFLSGRARTTFTRDRSGLHAEVFVPVSGDFAELLAHELEHVIEQIEGVNLRRLARHRESGVRRIGTTRSRPRARVRRALQRPVRSGNAAPPSAAPASWSWWRRRTDPTGGYRARPLETPAHRRSAAAGFRWARCAVLDPRQASASS